MNEQILTKLVLQASDKDGWLDCQKFAELIVRECAEICLEANDHKNILRHFGVEE